MRISHDGGHLQGDDGDVQSNLGKEIQKILFMCRKMKETSFVEG
jgi:hypothetical protein